MLTALLIAAAVLILPGLALGWVLRLGTVRTAALAGPFAVLLLAGAGVVFAWAGTAPARAAAASGSPVDLPEATGKRDGSGVPGSQPIAAAAGPLASRVPALVEG